MQQNAQSQLTQFVKVASLLRRTHDRVKNVSNADIPIATAETNGQFLMSGTELYIPTDKNVQHGDFTESYGTDSIVTSFELTPLTTLSETGLKFEPSILLEQGSVSQTYDTADSRLEVSHTGNLIYSVESTGIDIAADRSLEHGDFSESIVSGALTLTHTLGGKVYDISTTSKVDFDKDIIVPSIHLGGTEVANGPSILESSGAVTLQGTTASLKSNSLGDTASLTVETDTVGGLTKLTLLNSLDTPGSETVSLDGANTLMLDTTTMQLNKDGDIKTNIVSGSSGMTSLISDSTEVGNVYVTQINLKKTYTITDDPISQAEYTALGITGAVETNDDIIFYRKFARFYGDGLDIEGINTPDEDYPADGTTHVVGELVLDGGSQQVYAYQKSKLNDMFVPGAHKHAMSDLVGLDVGTEIKNQVKDIIDQTFATDQELTEALMNKIGEATISVPFIDYKELEMHTQGFIEDSSETMVLSFRPEYVSEGVRFTYADATTNGTGSTQWNVNLLDWLEAATLGVDHLYYPSITTNDYVSLYKRYTTVIGAEGWNGSNWDLGGIGEFLISWKLSNDGAGSLLATMKPWGLIGIDGKLFEWYKFTGNVDYLKLIRSEISGVNSLTFSIPEAYGFKFPELLYDNLGVSFAPIDENVSLKRIMYTLIDDVNAICPISIPDVHNTERKFLHFRLETAPLPSGVVTSYTFVTNLDKTHTSTTDAFDSVLKVFDVNALPGVNAGNKFKLNNVVLIENSTNTLTVQKLNDLIDNIYYADTSLTASTIHIARVYNGTLPSVTPTGTIAGGAENRADVNIYHGRTVDEAISAMYLDF